MKLDFIEEIAQRNDTYLRFYIFLCINKFSEAIDYYHVLLLLILKYLYIHNIRKKYFITYSIYKAEVSKQEKVKLYCFKESSVMRVLAILFILNYYIYMLNGTTNYQ